MNTLSGAMLAAALGAAVVVAGCGGDDAQGQPSGPPDAAPDVVVIPQGDGGTPPVDGSITNPDGAGGCNFATFVKGLIANDTTASALPSADLGQACTDNQNQAEFQSLFP